VNESIKEYIKKNENKDIKMHERKAIAKYIRKKVKDENEDSCCCCCSAAPVARSPAVTEYEKSLIDHFFNHNPPDYSYSGKEEDSDSASSESDGDKIWEVVYCSEEENLPADNQTAYMACNLFTLLLNYQKHQKNNIISR
jgi:hypothetical protein